MDSYAALGIYVIFLLDEYAFIITFIVDFLMLSGYEPFDFLSKLFVTEHFTCILHALSYIHCMVDNYLQPVLHEIMGLINCYKMPCQC